MNTFLHINVSVQPLFQQVYKHYNYLAHAQPCRGPKLTKSIRSSYVQDLLSNESKPKDARGGVVHLQDSLGSSWQYQEYTLDLRARDVTIIEQIYTDYIMQACIHHAVGCIMHGISTCFSAICTILNNNYNECINYSEVTKREHLQI